MYKKYVKRILDCILSLISIILLSPILLIIWVLVRVKLGRPAIFKQQRPGLNEKIFTLYKFRTMTNEIDENGNLLPDEKRLNRFGKVLRSTSLDELPELLNILKGDMSIVGPRPLLVEYLDYYTEYEKHRHDVRPGLTGLAQINGRNNIGWDERFKLDIRYVEQISIKTDIEILFNTVKVVLNKSGIQEVGNGMETNMAEERRKNGDNLKIISFENKEKWQEFEKKGVEVYYTWEYVSAFNTNGDGLPYLLYLNEGTDYVYNVIMKRDIEKMKIFQGKVNNVYDISTPYGYGGMDIIGEYNQKLIDIFKEEFKIYCNNSNIISEFVRLNPTKDNYKYYDQDKIKNIANTILMKLENEEQIWNDMESRCRNTIRKAQKSNIKIETGFNKELLEQFKKIYYETMKRDSADGYYFFKEDFFEDFYNNMSTKSFIMVAYLNGEPISASIFMYENGIGHYHLSGTLSEYLSYGSNSLILYEAAKYLCKKDCKLFHLGGGYGGNDNPLYRFKKSFTKTGVASFYIGKNIYNEKTYNELVKIRENDKKFDKDTNYFPKYRGE